MAERHDTPAARTYAVTVSPPYQGLNLRSGPGAEHPVLRVIPDGTKVQAAGKSRKGWLPVQDGWVDKQYLKEV